MQVTGTINYRKIQQIGVGQGCNSQVFLIDEPQLGGVLVAKEVEKNKFQSVEEYFKEAQMIFASYNPNVVPINYACDAGEKVVLVMPYFSQGSLADRIQQNPLSLKEVIRVAQGALNGLHHIHIKNYLHLDIKPSNILFSDNNEPMVADFGQSDSLNRNGIVTSPRMYIQTLPPEIFSTMSATIYSDIYLMGVTLYRAVNGDDIFNNQKIEDMNNLQTKIQKGEFPDRNCFLPHVPKKLRRIIKKALNVEPQKRYQSAIEFADALGNVEIPLDWNTSTLSNDNICWKAIRGHEKPDLIVELTKNTEDLWDVYVLTDNRGRRRKKTTYCKHRITYSDAKTHLETVFSDLS